MTPQQAYEKQYAGCHAWEAAPPHVKDLWLDAWTMAANDEREACAKVCEDLMAPPYLSRDEITVWDVASIDCAEAIRARGQA